MAQILLAEPDRRIREFVAGILADFGHDVTACEDGVDATALSATGPIDFLLTDLVLCGGTGTTLSRHCAALGIPTITLTGQEFHVDQAERDRPPPLVDKPFRFDDLQCLLDAVAVTSASKAAFDLATRKAA